MKYLLDTHILLWYIKGIPRLSREAVNVIEDRHVVKLISIASLWEIAIKVNKGKLNITMPFSMLDKFLELNHFEILDVNFEHLLQLQKLPSHHNDPFDHLLISQAISENLTIISADRHFASYPINVIA